MIWLLTILMIGPDGSSVQTEVGTMVNEPICDIAGEGFAMVLREETPGLVVMWKCEPLGVSA